MVFIISGFGEGSAVIDAGAVIPINPGSLEPEFFSGPDNGVFISLGPAGLGSPGCAPVGSLYIYNITVTFGTPIPIPWW